jgi:large conductance mechanosensitive channel
MEEIKIAKAMPADSRGRFVDAPSKFDFHEYRQMERCIGTVEDSAAAEQLWRAIKGRGAFRCFKDTASQPGLLQPWYQYRDSAMKTFVRDWAGAHQIPIMDDTGSREDVFWRDRSIEGARDFGVPNPLMVGCRRKRPRNTQKNLEGGGKFRFSLDPMNGMGGMLKEFKEFALKGNLVDMAVAFVMGAAFTKLSGSFIEDLVMPLVATVTGGVDYSNKYLPLAGHIEPGLALAAAREQGAVWAYGSFITNGINFLIVALVMFFVVKAINKARHIASREAAAAPPPAPGPEEKLLTEIRDLLRDRK